MGIVETLSGAVPQCLKTIYVSENLLTKLNGQEIYRVTMVNLQVSVLIPTCNGGPLFERLLEMLDRQTLRPVEIIVADSQSSDRTPDICARFGARVIPVERRSFDHGGTRTMLAKEARGDIVVYFTQDAVPADETALALLVSPLQTREVGCSYGRQLPAADASLFAAHLRNFNYPDSSEIHRYSDRHRLGFRTAFMSNSFSAYRKTVLRDVGYFKNGLIFGEDTCTVGKILQAGFNAAYCAEAVVIHSHNYSVAVEFKRSYDIGVMHSLESWMLEEFGSAEGVGRKYVKSLLQTIVVQRRYCLLGSMVLRLGAKYLGYKLGRNYSLQPRFMRRWLSMNGAWWDTSRL